MKKLTIIYLLLLFVNITQFAQWQILNEGERGSYGPIDFVSDDVGWKFGSKSLFKTEDFGLTWSEIVFTEVDSGWVLDIDFLNETTGWVLVNDEKGRTRVFFTQDNGNTWQLKLDTSSIELGDIFALDDQNVYAWHGSDNVIKTNDGGETWIDVSPSFKEEAGILLLWFLNSEIGVIIGWDQNFTGKFVSRTFDGGQNWQTRTTDFELIEDLSFINDSTGYFKAYRDGEWLFCETKDTCSTWSVKYHKANIATYTFLSPDTVYSVMDDEVDNGPYLMFSADAGITWEQRQSLSFGGYNIYFNHKNRGLITGVVGLGGYDLGKIDFRSNNRGTTWENSLLTYPFLSTYFIDDEKGFAGGGASGAHYSNGDILITKDGGISWDKIFTAEDPVNFIQFVNGQTGFALLESHWDRPPVLRTTDGGLNWDNPFQNGDDMDGFRAEGVCFIDENTGWLVGYDEPYSANRAVILGTTDGGKSWSKAWQHITLWPPSELYSTHFADSVGWAVGLSGMIVKYTVDKQWQQIDSPTDLPLNKVYFSDKNHGWIAGGYKTDTQEKGNFILLKTENGGADWEMSETNYQINDLYFLDSLNGWAVGNDTIDYGDWPTGRGVILHTSNGGDNWQVQVEGLNGWLEGIHFQDGYVWAVGNLGLVMRTDDGITWVEQSTGNAYPNTFSLSQNYPNPFQGSTHININLDTQQKIVLRVLNQSGSEIEVIANETLTQGSHEFVFEGQSLPSGIYYVQLVSGDITQIRKMIKFE